MIASILVDIKAHAVDKTFDYSVKKEFENVIEIGQRVLVPFGVRNITGFVMNLKETSEFKKLKEITEILDIIPALSQELIELGKEISISNVVPLVSIYQAMLPRALKAKYEKVFTVVDKTLLSEELSLNFNTNNETKNSTKLEAFLYEIKKNITSKNIIVSYQAKHLSKEKYIKKIILIDDTLVLRGQKQRAVVEYLEKHNKVALKSDILNDLNISAQTLTSLIKKNVVKEDIIEVYRQINSIYKPSNKRVVLNDEQVNVYNEIKESLNKENVFLLKGVTGSGKTEVYLNIIEDVLKTNKEAIMLVPEISLTPMMVSRFKGRFKENVALLHSGLSIGEKYDEWRKIKRKEVSVVVGARSAIFAPFENLGIIIIDEEHSETYKQMDNPKYHALDIALLRSKYHKIPIVLGSATPSIVSYAKSLKGLYKLLTINERANKTKLPEVHLVDMAKEFRNGNRNILSKKLEDLIVDRLDKNEQIMLLLNRRGHSTFVICRSCGEVIMCPNCDISLTYHENNDSLVCHYCGHKENSVSKCPNCNSQHIRYMGIGTEKVEEYLQNRFTTAKIVRMDMDTTTKKGAHEKLLYDFEMNGDILLGTQMISKGLDFERVTLVGVLAADMSLSLPDYQAIEKTFQLITQVSGRAGRHELEGEVVIQTYNVDHYAISTAKNHDYEAFYQEEMLVRKIAGYSPYYNLVQIIVSDKDVKKVLKEGSRIVLKLRKNLSNEAVVLGPVLPKIARINNIYRAQIILKYRFEKVDELLREIYEEYNELIAIGIDKNPNLL
ncbi:primosomal protein N' [Candidatus Izimaplasma bacterium ZiA1]|uniref:primosomal protein N' n=1 Tax=Candidatus Izimoplasma sp. ZiA1 TaxID=2024899 RepID=UPI000BAA8D6E|nr:primosomal protein N' [Candidatus Izimaplasma bacterium ZiA1]